jgi:tripartite tricarboxylate transporter family receptor
MPHLSRFPREGGAILAHLHVTHGHRKVIADMLGDARKRVCIQVGITRGRGSLCVPEQFAPRDTPAGIINKLSDMMNVALADANSKARLADIGVEPMRLTSAEFAKFIADETDKWAKVIKSAGIKVIE